MRRILSALALCALGFAANSERASAEITYPWCAESAAEMAARATGAFGPTNNAWPRSRTTAAIAKPRRCTTAPNQG
jgi:hypothetical protein